MDNMYFVSDFIVLEFLLCQISLFLHLMVSDFTVSKFLLCQLSLFRNFDCVGFNCVGFHCSGIFIVLDFIAVEFFFHFQNSLCRNSDCVWCVVLKF